MDLFTAANNYGYTENGALTYKSTLNANLDLFSMGGACRSRSEEDIMNLITKAWNEDNQLCMKILLYLRDIRGGMGEKRIYRTAINSLANDPSVNKEALVKATVEVGSWDDVFSSLPLEIYGPYVKKVYQEHVKEDKYDLMEKWMPSIGGASNKQAEKLASYLGLTPRNYRKYLSRARASLKLVESNLCTKNYEEIDYEKLPSRAGYVYRKAFYRHDEERYKNYITAASEGKAKMNTSTLFPYDIVKPIIDNLTSWRREEEENFDSLEAMWKNLPPLDVKNGRALAVVDVSGSMYGLPICVATSLGILFAQNNPEPFHNKIITFSAHPNFITFKDEDNLQQKLKTILKANWDMNTDLQAVFNLILKTAVEYNLPESEMPATLYIISDMEFDEACSSRYTPKTNFEAIDEKYREAGYKRPTLVFWNVNSHQNNVPVKQDEKGTVLVSGCSPNVFKMALSNEVNPIIFMNQTVNTERYINLTKDICTA